MRRSWTVWTNGVLAAALVLSASSRASGEGTTGEAIAAAAAALPIGSPLPGMEGEAFDEAAETFAEEEFIEDGLGPTFNAEGCGTCHSVPVLGGSGTPDRTERRFGRVTDGVFFGFD